MPQVLQSVDVDVANCYIKMAAKVALGTVSDGENHQGIIGAVVVQNGDVLGEGQAHLKTGEAFSANCKAVAKAEQRALMAALANVEDRDVLKGATVYVAPVDAEGNIIHFATDDFLERCSQTSLSAGMAWWVLPYDKVIYRVRRREMNR